MKLCSCGSGDVEAVVSGDAAVAAGAVDGDVVEAAVDLVRPKDRPKQIRSFHTSYLFRKLNQFTQNSLPSALHSRTLETSESFFLVPPRYV